MAGGQSRKYPKSKSTQERYDRFCMAYHTNGNNGAEAAREAGYSKNSARQQAERLLTNVYIKERLAELKKDTVEKYENTVEDRLKILDRVIEEGFKLKGKGKQKFANDLRAVIAAVAEQNKMLGVTQGNGEESLIDQLAKLAESLPS